MGRILTIISLLLLPIIILLANKPDVLNIFSRPQSLNIQDLTGDYDFFSTTANFNNRRIPVPAFVATTEPLYPVLGKTNVSKRIEVDLDLQKLYAFENNQQVYDFTISSGKSQPTPTGTFRIWTKQRYATIKGGSKLLNTDFLLPNIPFVMYFSGEKLAKKKGFCLNGTYWHKSFGKPMSHGCIDIKLAEAQQLYHWAKPDLKGNISVFASTDNTGSQVYIY